MATFLVTPQMNPGLRARVERAVSHRRRAKDAAAKLGLQGSLGGKEKLRLARVLPVLLLLVVAGLGTAMFVVGKRELERERTALLTIIQDRRAALPGGHDRFLGVTDHYITETAGDTAPPDSIEASLKAPGALDALLKRPAVYLHGSAPELADSAKIDAAAKASDKDSFLVCLASPPATNGEKDLLAKVKGVYFQGAKVDEATASVRRLTDARAALLVLSPAFEEQVRTATEWKGLRMLRHDLEAVPAERAGPAVAAEVLIVVADVAAKTNTRESRVAIVDLTTKTVLYRGKPHVDNQGRTAASTFYSAEVDGCAMALAVRQSLEK